jgi:hypothetical protein
MQVDFGRRAVNRLRKPSPQPEMRAKFILANGGAQDIRQSLGAFGHIWRCSW